MVVVVVVIHKDVCVCVLLHGVQSSAAYMLFYTSMKFDQFRI